MDFSSIAYPDGMMERVERDAAEAEGKREHQLTSIFRKAEALMVYGEYREALLFFADKERVAAYPVALVDFLLCELFPEFEKRYRLFMAGASDQVKESITGEQRRAYENAMLTILGLVVTLRRDRPDDETPFVSWTTIVAAARSIAAKAPNISAPPPQ